MKNIFIILALFFTFAQTKELEKVSLQLHWKYQFQFAGFIMAKEKGYYDDVGLDVELKEYRFGINVEDEVLSQRANYGIYSSAILLSYLEGKPIELMASFFKRSAMVIVSKPEIKSPKDLIGKTIMADTKKDFDLKFKHMFNSLAIDTDDLHLVKHTYNVDDFANDSVDAMTAFISDQPYKLDALAIKYNILDPSDYGVYSLLLELFTSVNEAEDHLQRTQKFKEASIKGWKYALENINKTVDVIHAKYAPDMSIETLLSEAHNIKKLILPYVYEIGSIDENYLIRQTVLFEDSYHLQEHEQIESFIFNKQTRVDHTLFWQLLAVTSILFLIALFFILMLKKNNKKLHQLLNSTIDAIGIFKEGKLIEVNDVFLELYGYDSLDEIKNKKVSDFVHKEHHPFLSEQLKNTQKPYEINLLKKDGTVFPALVRGTAIDEHTRISSVIDLTELKNTQGKLEELNQSLEKRVEQEVEKNRKQQTLIMQKNHLVQMGEMLNNIAHQWRQPLNSINSNVAVMSAVLEKESIDQEMLLSKIENIENNTQYMSDTIEDFSNFLRPDKQKREFVLHHTVKSVLALLESRSKNIKIHITQDAEVVLCSFKEEYHQVLVTILHNAIDNFASKKTEDPQINIVISEDKEMTYLSICDNGGGIKKENIARIFDPYFTTKFANEGVGLGLYMAKMLSEESMQGRLEVCNKGQGACFDIKIPKGVANV